MVFSQSDWLPLALLDSTLFFSQSLSMVFHSRISVLWRSSTPVCSCSRACLWHFLHFRSGELMELGTVAAAMVEVQERVGVPENTILIEPTIAAAFARDRGAEPSAPNAEDELFLAKVKTVENLLMILHSEPPRHFTHSPWTAKKPQKVFFINIGFWDS